MQCRWVGVLVLATATGGCATLVRGTSDHVSVISDPPGAVATTSLGTSCTTPCSLDVDRKAEFSVTVAKPGYLSRTVSVRTRIAGAGAAAFTENIATVGLGGAVDVVTGAVLEHVPSPVTVVLPTLGRAPATKPHHLPVS